MSSYGMSSVKAFEGAFGKAVIVVCFYVCYPAEVACVTVAALNFIALALM
jgi:hypothetical protein